jgi:hypothetical protein
MLKYTRSNFSQMDWLHTAAGPRPENCRLGRAVTTLFVLACHNQPRGSYYYFAPLELTKEQFEFTNGNHPT